MKMDTKKLAATFAILMIALGIAGFAYAHWEKIVTVDGTVTTGTLHLTPTFSATHDGWKDYNGNGKRDDGEDIMTLTSKIEDNTLTITIDNAFPCVTITGKFDLHNDGTIPAGLYNVKITAPTGVRWDLSDPGKIKVYDGDKLIATGTYTINGDFTQIDPGKEPYIDFTLHFEEDLPQKTTYTFKIELIYWNWNEVPD